MDVRYLAGEAAPYANLWRPIVESFAAINRHDVGAIPDVVVVDNSQSWLPPGSSMISVPALLELVPDLTMRIPIVHSINQHGAVFGHVMEGTNQDGGDVNWSFVSVLDCKGHVETFPDDQLDVALARFEGGS